MTFRECHDVDVAHDRGRRRQARRRYVARRTGRPGACSVGRAVVRRAVAVHDGGLVDGRSEPASRDAAVAHLLDAPGPAVEQDGRLPSVSRHPPRRCGRRHDRGGCPRRGGDHGGARRSARGHPRDAVGSRARQGGVRVRTVLPRHRGGPPFLSGNRTEDDDVSESDDDAARHPSSPTTVPQMAPARRPPTTPTTPIESGGPSPIWERPPSGRCLSPSASHPPTRSR